MMTGGDSTHRLLLSTTIVVSVCSIPTTAHPPPLTAAASRYLYLIPGANWFLDHHHTPADSECTSSCEEHEQPALG